jgi:hypothetical protein
VFQLFREREGEGERERERESKGMAGASWGAGPQDIARACWAAAR